jgi:hypothetical protein
MSSEKRKIPQLPAPNAGELDVLAVLWQEREGDSQPLKLSEVYKRVCKKRRQHGDPEPALTTVSTHLRKLTEKKLIQEVTGAPASSRSFGQNRGMLTPPTRSPLTSYQAIYGPREVLFTTFKALAAAYPPDRRRDSLVDFAFALGLPGELIQKVQKILGSEE